MGAPDTDWLEGVTERADPMVGKVIDGRYEVGEELGRGGAGVVYRARHVRLDKPLALKVLRRELSQRAITLRRFEREARAASSIGNPHIIDMVDFGELPEGDAYIVMEFLEGRSLKRAVSPGLRMPANRAVAIVLQLCDALEAAHARGIVHRDLKPDNIFLTQHGSDRDFVKVLDFGIAKVGHETRLTETGHFLGTPVYMSPEQCRGAEVDARTDLYSIGVILYELVSGRAPFEADHPIALATKHMTEPVVPPLALSPPAAISAELQSIILRCLEKKPSDRFDGSAELAAALQQLTDAAAEGDGFDTELTPLPEELPPAVTEQQSGAPTRAGVGPESDQGPAGPHAACQPTDQPLLSIPDDQPTVAAADPFASTPLGTESLVEGSSGSPRRKLPWVLTGSALLLIVVVIFFWARPEAASPAPVAQEPSAASEPVSASPGDRPEPAEATEMEPSGAGIEPSAVPAPIHIESDPPGARVFVAGQLVGTTPTTLARPTESATVVLRLAGHRAARRTLTPDSATTLSVPLEPHRARRYRPDSRGSPMGDRRAPDMGGTLEERPIEPEW